jgi:hypothetical protein
MIFPEAQESLQPSTVFPSHRTRTILRRKRHIIVLLQVSFTYIVLFSHKNMRTISQTNVHAKLAIFSTLLHLTVAISTPTVAIPSALTSFPTTLTKTKWTSYSTSTQYPNPGLPLFSEQQWVDTTIVTVYEPWLSAPTSFPYTILRISETTAKNELRITSEWNRPASTITLLSNAWTVRETLIL